MEDRWFVNARGSGSMEAVRNAGGDQYAHPEEVLDINGHKAKMMVFEVTSEGAESLALSVRDGGQPWTLRYFRKTILRLLPFEDNPVKRKSTRIINKIRRDIKAAQKARLKG